MITGYHATDALYREFLVYKKSLKNKTANTADSVDSRDSVRSGASDAVDHSPLGYWQKPQLVKLLAFGYLAFPLMFWWRMHQGFAGPVGSGWATGVAAGAGANWMSPAVFGQELFCAVSAAVALLWVSRPSLFYLIFLSIYFFGFKFYLFLHHGIDTPLEVTGMMFWFAAPATLVASRARLAYLEPERRWWKRPERYVHSTVAHVLVRGVKFPLVVLNLSVGGAFVKLDERIFQELPEGAEDKRRDGHRGRGPGRALTMTGAERLLARKEIHAYPRLGEIVSVAIETLSGLDSPFPKNRFVTTAEVVWVTKVTDPYQYGLGFKFTGLSVPDRLRLRRYLKLLPSEKF